MYCKCTYKGFCGHPANKVLKCSTLQSAVSQQQLISQKLGVKSQRQSKKIYCETTEMNVRAFIHGDICLIIYPLASAQVGHWVQVWLLWKRLEDGWIDGLELVLYHSAQHL